MPVGTRVRGNNAQGAVSDNPLGAAATTLNSAGLANLPAVTAGNHAVIILDPLRTAGAPEIVIVTAHTAAATSATVSRGAYGTTARSHAQNVAWVHAPTIDDVVQVLTSATRPSDPYRGQLVFETDTNSFVARDTSDAWQTAVPLGAWTAYTPTFTNLTVGNGTLSGGSVRLGRTIHFYVKFILGTTSTVGTAPTFSLPVAASARYSSTTLDVLGRVLILDAGTADFGGVSMFASSTTGALQVYNAASTYLQVNGFTATVPMTWTTGDGFVVYGTYEAAS